MTDSPKNPSDKTEQPKPSTSPDAPTVQLTPEELEKIRGGLDSVRRGGWDGN